MLRNSTTNRTFRENQMLASSTAFVSGYINVAGMLGLLVFTSNVTGHVASLANHIVRQHFHEIMVFMIWLLMFFFGAFTSNFIIRSFEHKSYYTAHSTPVILEIFILLFVAIYGNHFFAGSDTEREYIIGALLFANGLQNNMVSTVSGGLVKTSHLTGLFTDLGGEVAEWLHPKSLKAKITKEKILIRTTILGCYITGGIVGGIFFDIYGFAIFYFVPLILLTILYYDLSPLALHKLARLFGRPGKTNNFKQ
ncbi:YoaK family protein [Mucilaginibacter sp. KACC 22063]|uniref:YoaK family protein n=1 Tax=Mucilaginibacter sp. KACC 22063 TaxID=3025666 RepID=UPI002367372F|nr:YoaK family protein [Mucilaginibacter sp. KACC 22063]WDF54786.1 YoaK family protein [Mucilaginibacter sp. KACC 22063]